MDTVNSKATSTLGDMELEHVTQEMYKKNAQLAYTNKTLSILRKIDEIILSTVTDPVQVAQQAADAVVLEAEYKIVTIFLYNKKNSIVSPLAVSENAQVIDFEARIGKKIKDIGIKIDQSKNPITLSIQEKTKQQTSSFSELYQGYLSSEELEIAQQILPLQSIFIFPLIVRSEIIGALLIGRSEGIDKLTDYDKDLMDRLVGVIGIAVDNALLYEEIEQANERLKQLDHLKDEFVSLASHELRTPMTVIKSYLWFLLDGKKGVLNDDQKKYVETAYLSTERLINLVNDMLNVSRIESGRLTVTIKPINIADLIEKIITGLLPRAAELKLSLVYQKPDASFPLVSADPERVEQVLINLVGNSLKFTPEGGTISMKLSQQGSRIITQVSDTGKGIKAEDLPKLFQKFGMVGESSFLTRQAVQGTGLGLYLSKSLIELMKGAISVASEGEGKGTTFMFSLPIAEQNATQATFTQ